MEYEPLKGKIKVDACDPRNEYEYVLFDDVKSAVCELLREIKEKKQECKKEKECREPRTYLWISYDGELTGLEKAEEV